jgi:competence protein ComGF
MVECLFEELVVQVRILLRPQKNLIKFKKLNNKKNKTVHNEKKRTTAAMAPEFSNEKN